jgi:hypothetical protein
LWTGQPPREAAARTSTAVPSALEDLPSAYELQPRNEKFFTLFSKAGSHVVESAAILMEFVAAPPKHRAELAKRMHDAERAGDDTSKGRPADRDIGTRRTGTTAHVARPATLLLGSAACRSGPVPRRNLR